MLYNFYYSTINKEKILSQKFSINFIHHYKIILIYTPCNKLKVSVSCHRIVLRYTPCNKMKIFVSCH